MIDVYLPNDEALARMIVPGSGIVGRASLFPERIALDYEGNIYGAVNMRTFADRVQIAASRAAANYPTVARALVERERVKRIGVYDEHRGTVTLTEPNAEAELAAWLGVRELPLVELETSDGATMRRRELELQLAQEPRLRHNPAVRRELRRLDLR